MRVCTCWCADGVVRRGSTVGQRVSPLTSLPHVSITSSWLISPATYPCILKVTHKISPPITCYIPERHKTTNRLHKTVHHIIELRWLRVSGVYVSHHSPAHRCSHCSRTQSHILTLCTHYVPGKKLQSKKLKNKYMINAIITALSQSLDCHL